MICLHFYGPSNTGKTKTITKIIKAIEGEGHTCACLKHLPHEEFLNKPKKDTCRFSEAGAKLVIGHAQNEIALSIDAPITLEQIVDNVERIAEPDVLLIEGYKKHGFPGLIDAKKFAQDPDKIIPFIKKELQVRTVLKNLPGLNCGKCGLDCETLARRIVEGKASMKDCKSLSDTRLDLRINKQEVPLSKFPKELMASVLEGIVKSLKHRGKLEEIEITYKRKK
jgi:molybdopterin-guanine dinucleotide biosynthesis protein B